MSKIEVMTKEEDANLFPFPTHLHPLDDFSGYLGCAALDSQFDFACQEPAFDALPLMEMVVNCDPIYPPPLDIDLSQCMFQGNLCNDFSLWNETTSEVDRADQNKQLLLGYVNEGVAAEDELAVKMEKNNINGSWSREEKGSSGFKDLSRKNLSKCFYMPISQAAKELNVGVTILKKRCRELGIRRWPYRKLKSLRTLIKNVQELGKQEGCADEQPLKEAIKLLEHEKKMLEEVPDNQLEGRTKRLRQACFKANYKKRKLMGMTEPQSQSQSPSIAPSEVNPNNGCASPHGVFKEKDTDDELGDEIKILLSDCFSSTDTIMF